MLRTHHVQGVTKTCRNPPHLILLAFNSSFTHTEYWTGNDKKKWTWALIAYTCFLQLVIIASKLTVHHCYRKTNYCVYCLDEFWFSDGSLSDKAKFNDPGLMPLPDTATGLDWSHLVDAARAFEGNRKNWIKITVHYANFLFYYFF